MRNLCCLLHPIYMCKWCAPTPKHVSCAECIGIAYHPEGRPAGDHYFICSECREKNGFKPTGKVIRYGPDSFREYGPGR